MTHQHRDERISAMETHWSEVINAVRGKGKAASTAQLRLLQQYGDAIQRYLMGALRDRDAAEELGQEFALRFIRGDFQGLDPARGRFRDYVKTVLFRLVANHFKNRQAQPRTLPADVAEPGGWEPGSADAEKAFVESWRTALLDRAWQGLGEIEKKTGQPFHSVLRLRVEHAEDEFTSAQLAEHLGARYGKKVTADAVRKTLQRAREKFAGFLIEDVIHSLDNPTPEQLERELRDLALLGYCRSVLERRKG